MPTATMKRTVTATKATLAPPPGIMVDNPTTTPGGVQVPNAPPQRFSLQSNAWINLQLYIASAMQLPIVKDDFESRYGTFSDEGQVEQALSKLQELRAAADKFGDPINGMQQLAAAQASATPPPDPYSQAVWVAGKIASNANMIATTYSQGFAFLGQMPTDQRLADLQSMLTGEGGLNSTALDLKGKCDNFSTLIANYIKATLNPAVTDFSSYLQAEGNILQDARQVVSQLDQQIKDTQDAIKQLNKEYIAYTVSACAGSVIVSLIPPLFMFGGAAVGGALGYEAAKTKQAIEAMDQKLSGLETELKQKVLLVSDLTNLQSQSQTINDDAAAFENAVGQLAAAFGVFSNNLETIANTTDPTTLENMSAFMDMVDLSTAVELWGDIATATTSFEVNGYISVQPQSGSGTSSN